VANNIHNTAYIGVGSNLGERETHLRQAISLIVQTPYVYIRRISSFLENPAVGGPEDAPPFLNAAVEVQTTLAPQTLMRHLLEIEQIMGRERRVKWEPRNIDLDLLLYGDEIISTDELIVPHPLMHERPFVLKPLAEIAPNAIHPTLQMTICGLLDNVCGEHQKAATDGSSRPSREFEDDDDD
jgi:2-amino-4-hydroxy-6-hydroxymethyldihydropteridine diphosphokinase